MEKNAIKNGLKDVGSYLTLIVVGAIVGISAFISIGYMDEIVVPKLGLNESGQAVTAINTFSTIVFAAIGGLAAIFTLAQGLALLKTVLEMFGIKINIGRKNDL